VTPTEIKAILKELGGTANKHLGQHFLVDRSALDAVVHEAHVHSGMVTLEVGPGLGVLTKALLDAGHDVVAIERDRRFLSYLEALSVEPRGSKNGAASSLRIVQGDAAEMDWMTIVGNREWQLVSNLPYAISSLALRLALWSAHPAENVVVMLQREVAERAISCAAGESRAKKSGKTSLLSLMVALASAGARIVKRVPPGAFYPPPKVDSAILQIEPLPSVERERRWGIDPERIMELAKKGFAHPRKLLASNLQLVDAAQVLLAVNLDPKVRAEDVSPEQWAALARTIGGE